MKLGWSLLGLVALLPIANVSAQDGCVPEAADPTTYNEITIEGRTFYMEERGNPLGTSPPVPLSGFLTGDGTWTWEERNGLPGLQRNDNDRTVVSTLCDLALVCSEVFNPTVDENCGHGSDDLVL